MGLIFSKWTRYFKKLFRREKPASSRRPHLHRILTTPFDSALAPLTSTPAHFLCSVDSFPGLKDLIPEKEAVSPITNDSSTVFTFHSVEKTRPSPPRVRMTPVDNCRRRLLANKLKLDPLPRPQKRLRV